MWFTAGATVLITSIVLAAWSWRSGGSKPNTTFEDPIVIQNTRWVEVRGKKLRLVFVAHPLGKDVPLLFFIHGFGGQLTQWTNQLSHFSKAANVLAVDLVGCGKSETASAEFFKTGSIVEDLATVLRMHRDKSEEFIAVCHSMGTMLGCKLKKHLSDIDLKALVFIAPKARFDEKDLKQMKSVPKVPNIVLNVWRLYDRIGGVNSASVKRFVNKNAPLKVRELQLHWNASFTTDSLKKYATGVRANES
ncbi:hypothetical protein HK102_009484 [Quaeritorhiza haematococci]|nr:hypothetical protein HK102_009484 [Quaeritorhiza haematococci]